jgi:glycosyltransferase A (GT-A) superfamily protein (DUF2064 family)
MLADIWALLQTASLPRVLASDGDAADYGLPIRAADAVWPQGEGPLHDRLERLSARAHRSGDIALFVGGDVPDLPVSLLSAAADALGSVDAAFVGAEDGGFVAAGFRRPVRLDRVRWSTEFALADALQAARAVGTAVVVGTHRDVDVVSDLDRLSPCRTAALWAAA